MIKKLTAAQLTVIGVMSAVICILGPVSIPIGVVPISFANFAIYLAVYALGMKKGSLSYLIYLCIGLIGIPVFSGFSSGPGKLLGPTGGYLIGFIFMVIICGLFIDKYIDKWYLCMAGMGLGLAVCYAFGTIWLAYQANLSMAAALAAGVIPFIPGDILKIIAAGIIGPQIRKQLVKAHLFQ